MINADKRAKLYQVYVYGIFTFLILTEITSQLIQAVWSCP